MNTHQQTVIKAVCYLESFASVIESYAFGDGVPGISESDIQGEVAKIRSLSKKLLKEVNVTALSGPLSDCPKDIRDN